MGMNDAVETTLLTYGEIGSQFNMLIKLEGRIPYIQNDVLKESLTLYIESYSSLLNKMCGNR